MATATQPRQLRQVDLRDQINPSFQPLLYSKERWLVLWGGAGSGKSIFAAQKMLIRAMQTPGEKMAVTRKVARTLRQSCFATVKHWIYNWGIENQWSINKSDLVMEYKPNGSQILFIGMDDQEKLKSIHGLTSLWHEEPTELSQEDLNQLDLRLRGESPSYKQHILSFNPISVMHWLRTRFFELPNDSLRVHHSTYKDNPIGLAHDQEYIKVLEGLQAIDPQLAAIYARGEWGVLQGLVYAAFDVVDELPEKFEDEFYSVDFGFNHPMVVLRNVVADGQPYVDELIYETRLLTYHVIEELRKLKVEHWIPIYCDAAEPDRIQEICLAGFNALPAVKGKGSVRAGIDHVKTVKPRITSRSANLLKESKTYKYAVDRNGNSFDEPIKFADHAMDAMRYGLFTHGRAFQGGVSTI